MTLGNGQSVVALVDEARFRATRLGVGYDMGQVDDFLERVTRASAAGGDVDSLLVAARFEQTGFLTQGYDAEDVDDFLEGLRRVATRA